jgi:hypothetical protein
MTDAPAGPQLGRHVADPGDGTVLFLIGMRINRLHRVRSWLPITRAMPQILAELEAHPEDGLLSSRGFWSGRVVMLVQHWRSAEDLGRYARRRDRRHAAAWAAFDRATASSGDVGVFHETYVVPADGIESRYVDMPPFGLGAATAIVPRRGAAGRGRRSRAERLVVGAEDAD